MHLQNHLLMLLMKADTRVSPPQLRLHLTPGYCVHCTSELESDGQYDENHVENVEVEQDEAPPAAPVDVRQGFKKLVTRYGHKFTGALSASHFYESAPNPYLHVEGVGLVGIPLSEAMITQIFSKHSKSGNSARKRKSNQDNTCDMWELDPGQVWNQHARVHLS
jgi:hypothetical protein